MSKKQKKESLLQARLDENDKWVGTADNRVDGTPPHSFAGMELIERDFSDRRLSQAVFTDAHLTRSNLNDAAAFNADFTRAGLKDTTIQAAMFRACDFSRVELQGADLRRSQFIECDFSGANLARAYLDGVDISDCNFHDANLSGARGIVDPVTYLKGTFEADEQGYIVYKIFDLYYSAPDEWTIAPGEIIREVVDHNRGAQCSYGISVGTSDWLRYHGIRGQRVWKCRIRFEWLVDVCVPFSPHEKIRTGRLELLTPLTL